MALTELQLPTKEDFYRNIQHAATEMNNIMRRWQDMAEFLATVDAADMTSIGVPTGQVRTDLVEFRTAVEEIISLYQGNSVTPTNVPDAVMDKIRRMT